MSPFFSFILFSLSTKASAVVAAYAVSPDDYINGVDLSITCTSAFMTLPAFHSLQQQLLSTNATLAPFQLQMLPASDEYWSARRDAVGWYLSFIVLTCIVFGTFFLFGAWQLVLNTRNHAYRHNPVLFASYVFVVLACLERLLYHAIDFKGYRGIMSARDRALFDAAFGDVFFLSIYSLLFTSWLHMAPAHLFWNIKVARHSRLLISLTVGFNLCLYVCMTIMVLLFP
jgi:hypothetical protein